MTRFADFTGTKILYQICEIRLCLADELECYTSCNQSVADVVADVVQEAVAEADDNSNAIDDAQTDNVVQYENIEENVSQDVTESETIFEEDVAMTEIEVSGDYEDAIHPIGNNSHIFDI